MLFDMYSDYIAKLKAEWIGKKVMYDGKVYTICHVDYNGVLHIDKPSEHNETTAAFLPYQAAQALVKEV